jgi:hypothetical protein
MKWNMFLGALVVSVGLCSQSFGFELLDRMLGLNDCGCNSCCEPQCCEKSCEPACPQPDCCAQPACEPACAAPACEPACATACDTGCCDNGCGHKHRRHGHGCCEGNVKCGCNHCGVKTCHSHDLFGGLRGLFHHDRCCNNGCGCQQDCCAQPACEPACAAPACEPACAAPACEPSCGCNQGCGNDCGCRKKRCHRGCLLDIFGHKHRCRKSCCNTGCNGCGAEPSCGCNGGVAPAGAPMPAAGAPTDAAPMPPAPMADPQASVRSHRRVVQASKVVRAN